MSDWEFFERDGAYFRKRKSLGRNAVEHVRHGSRWVDYTGDRTLPVLFGDQVTEEEATAGMEPEPRARGE